MVRQNTRMWNGPTVNAIVWRSDLLFGQHHQFEISINFHLATGTSAHELSNSSMNVALQHAGFADPVSSRTDDCIILPGEQIVKNYRYRRLNAHSGAQC